MGNYNSDQKNARFYGLKLSRTTDADIISQLDRQESIQGYIKELIRRDMTMKKNEINYLNRHSEELFAGHKLTAYGKVFWANMTTREIYAHSEDAEIAGVINGDKVAEITEDWQII